VFVNEIVNKSSTMKAHNSDKVVSVYDIILWYGSGIVNARFEVDRDYPYSDDRGKYRTSSMGGRQMLRWKSNPFNFTTINGKVYQKTYDSVKDRSEPYDNFWVIPYTKTIYPYKNYISNTEAV